MSDLILTKHFGDPSVNGMEGYKAVGGYAALAKALDMQPMAVIDEVKRANLRGRGGAGFSAGLKWSFVPMTIPKPRYLCVNADEGEPGTCKDKVILERCPHMMLEGIVIACWALQVHHAYIYVRGEFERQIQNLQRAVDEAYAAGFIGPNVMGREFRLEVTVHRGAGAYICGEETALISSLEGKRGLPRIKPPFPAVVGAFGCPTVVNNVETLAFVPHVIANGADWWLKTGSEKNPGTRMFSVSGHVNKPGVYELPMGTTIREIIDVHGGGVWKGRKVKAVIPGGASAAPLIESELDTKADFDSLAKAGSMGGSGGIIVIDDQTCIVRTAMRIARFFAHESCGQCTPCREGTDWAYKIMRRIELGKASQPDIDKLMSVCRNMSGITICVLADGAAGPLMAFARKFPEEYQRHVTEHRCPYN